MGSPEVHTNNSWLCLDCMRQMISPFGVIITSSHSERHGECCRFLWYLSERWISFNDITSDWNYHIIGCLYFHFIIILSASLNFASGMETWLSAKWTSRFQRNKFLQISLWVDIPFSTEATDGRKNTPPVPKYMPRFHRLVFMLLYGHRGTGKTWHRSPIDKPPCRFDLQGSMFVYHFIILQGHHLNTTNGW